MYIKQFKGSSRDGKTAGQARRFLRRLVGGRRLVAGGFRRNGPFHPCCSVPL